MPWHFLLMTTWHSTKVIASLIISRRIEIDPKNLPPPDVSQRGSASDADVYSALTKNLWFSYLTTATKCYSDSFLICLLRSYSVWPPRLSHVLFSEWFVLVSHSQGRTRYFEFPWFVPSLSYCRLLKFKLIIGDYERLLFFFCCCFNAEIHFQSSMLLKSDWIAEFGSHTQTVETFDHILGYTAAEG